MFTPTLRCECAQPASDQLMRKWCIIALIVFLDDLFPRMFSFYTVFSVILPMLCLPIFEAFKMLEAIVIPP